MRSLFNFNSSAVDSVSREGFEDRLLDLGEDIEDAIRDALLKRAPGEDYDISWDENGIAIYLTDEQFDMEYGTPFKPFTPAVRSALVSAGATIQKQLVLHE